MFELTQNLKKSWSFPISYPVLQETVTSGRPACFVQRRNRCYWALLADKQHLHVVLPQKKLHATGSWRQIPALCFQAFLQTILAPWNILVFPGIVTSDFSDFIPAAFSSVLTKGNAVFHTCSHKTSISINMLFASFQAYSPSFLQLLKCSDGELCPPSKKLPEHHKTAHAFPWPTSLTPSWTSAHLRLSSTFVGS